MCLDKLYVFLYQDSNFMEFLNVYHTLVSLLFSLPINIFDIILIVAFIFYVFEEASLGALPALTNLAATVAAFIGGLLFYPHLASLLISAFSLSKGISDALSFILIAVALYAVTSNVIAYFTRRTSLVFPNMSSRLLGGAFGVLSFLLICSFIVSVLLSFPVSIAIKSQIKSSLTGRLIFTRTLSFELATRRIFGGAISESLNFLTIKPDADSTVTLHFKTNNGTVDSTSEKKMIALINAEREKKGIDPLIFDRALTQDARAHAKDMLVRGYFSHYTPEGLSPFDRLENNSISYTSAAENLAFAPEVDLAMSGLMKSDGHRKNILDTSFIKVGVGVIDAGVYGKMFVQEFSN